MAGYQNAKERLAEANAEIARLKAKLSQFERESRPKRRRIVSRTYDPSIIDELLEWSEEGQFLDECLAAWGIDAETWKQWVTDHVELRAAVGPARARAKAAMLKTLREALRTRSAFPTSLADRIIAMVEREHAGEEGDAAGLIRLDLCPRCASADAQSTAGEAQAIEIAGPSVTG